MPHAHGTFCFAELHTTDVDHAKKFYGAVLGWGATDVPGAGNAYALFQLDGRDVAAVRRAEGPTRWVPYLAVEDAERTALRAQELRANLLSAPSDRPGFGRTSIIHDPAGGVVGLWEAHGHSGAAVIDLPGSMWWVELLTREVFVAKSFYAALLGWQPVDTLKYGIRYTVFKNGDAAVAGLLPIGADWGPTSPRWQILFAVDNCDARLERATAAGGSIAYGPTDIPNAGRAAVVTDPQGAFFVMMQPNEVVT